MPSGHRWSYGTSDGRSQNTRIVLVGGGVTTDVAVGPAVVTGGRVVGAAVVPGARVVGTAEVTGRVVTGGRVAAVVTVVPPVQATPLRAKFEGTGLPALFQLP